MATLVACPCGFTICLGVPSGVGAMDFAKACNAMLDGMTSAITDLKPKSLSLIRIVILQQAVFQAFRSASNLTSCTGIGAATVLNFLSCDMFLQIRAGEPLWTNSHSSPQHERSVLFIRLEDFVLGSQLLSHNIPDLSLA